MAIPACQNNQLWHFGSVMFRPLLHRWVKGTVKDVEPHLRATLPLQPPWTVGQDWATGQLQCYAYTPSLRGAPALKGTWVVAVPISRGILEVQDDVIKPSHHCVVANCFQTATIWSQPDRTVSGWDKKHNTGLCLERMQEGAETPVAQGPPQSTLHLASSPSQTQDMAPDSGSSDRFPELPLRSWPT